MMSEKVRQQKKEMLLRNGAGKVDFVTVANRLNMDQWQLVKLAGECGVRVVGKQGTAWDVMEIAVVIKLRQKHVKWSVIAAAIGRTVAACNGFMGRLDRELFEPDDDPITESEILELKSQGMSLSKAATQTGIERRKFRSLCEKHGVETGWGFVPWTRKEENEALRLRETGMSYAQVGEKIGRTRHSVWQKIKSLETVSL